ncbi:alpha/beta hydrolase [Thalassococcus sp. CAU 1522]|uniref:Alpha/beta hydrolase n=1 Tax=Thalassococcus arenae TaxID=2851652 RepID=A0ABS6N8W7_9RHOB|nr:alpha/beta hydrolase [Thalassococcus arenae]MBV2360253.1 alpha/beta hydrolase [Thalassococcus arenae]
MRGRRRFLIGTGAVALAVGLGLAGMYRRDIGRARRALAARPARIVETRHGPVEVAETGQGPALLMLHGTGGGFDQGLLLARGLARHGYRIVAPSRFGYLGTPMPAGATHRHEAEAIADLLDALGLERVAVAGVSAGAIPALSFAGLYPDRTAALLPLVPALKPPGAPLVEPWPPLLEQAVFAALGSDLLFWAATRFARDRLIGTVLATDPALVRAAPAAERARIDALIDTLMPISARVEGLLFDNRQTNRVLDLPLDRITAPTLILSTEDDRFMTARNARWLAGRIAGSELLILPDGGHVWAGHDDTATAAMLALLRDVQAAW